MPPFTYQHFIQAVRSLKDDMLRCYFDEAIGIYCTLRHISVGPRPASFKDFSTQYADAYEAANNAILIAAKKIGSYNPAIGEFRSYLHTSLENALKDILKADGYLPSSSNDIENEPDTTESDTDERVRRHKDDAFETMIRLIDTLPEIKRAAVYASAFGQVLRPDLKGYGRNYADILAQMYNTTALYIRQLATEGKQAAIDEVHRQGFNERSMSEVYMGALQVRTPVRDINDEVLEAVGQLDEFQQFMLLRHLAGVNVGSNMSVNNLMSFVYETEDNAHLTSSEEKILDEIEGFTPFAFADLANFRELRNRTGLKVIISDRLGLCKLLDDCIKRIEGKIDDYKKAGLWQNEKFGANVENEIYSRLRWAKKQREIATNQEEGIIPLLGLYTRKLLWFDSANPVVYLFSDNINDYAEYKTMPSKHVFGFVFIHEMMHAYYDAFHSFGFPSKEQLEEAFAEFGMLTFIERAFGTNSDLFTDAQRSVADKIELGPREYGFGLSLYDKSSGNREKMINTYKDISNWIDSSIIYKDFPNKGLGNYFIDIFNYSQNPNENNSNQCFNDVQDILNYSWPIPSLRPQASICTGSMFKTPTVQPNPLSHNHPLTVCQPKQAIKQYTIIRETEIGNFVTVLIRLLKLVGVESKLSLNNKIIEYSGERLFYYSNTTSAQPQKVSVREVIIPEMLCINGLNVYPRCRLLTSLCTKLVCVLSDIVGTEFYFISDSNGKGYALYGPEICSEYNGILYEKEKRYEKCFYEVSLRSTSEVIGQHERMSKVPLIVMKHFCETHKDVTWRDVQRIIDKVDCTAMGQFLEWITPKSIVDAVSAFYNTKLISFHPTPVTLGSGETLLVTRGWAFMPDAFTDFLKVADSLGYDIRET